MFAKKSISRVSSVLLIVIFILIGVLPARAESLTSPRYASGDFLWAKGMGGTGSDVGYRIAVDSNGNIYTTGFFSGTVDFDSGTGTFNLTSVGSNDTFITKLNSGGDFVWAKSIGGTSTDEGYDITVDSSANVYIVGSFSGTADFDPGIGVYNMTSAGSGDIFVTKLDNSGNLIWAKGMGGTSDDRSHSITVDSNGNVYTNGYFLGIADFDPGIGISNLTSAGSSDIFVSKLNSNGDFVWAKSIEGIDYDSGNGITVDSSGNIYTTGAFSGTADFDPSAGVFNLTSAGGGDIFVSKLDINGDFFWAKSMGGIGNDQGRSITLNSSGNVYLVGSFSGTADLDPDSGISNLISAGSDDVFISKLNSDGNFIWTKGMGGTGYDSSDRITLDSSNNIYTTGWFYDTVDFDPGTGISNLTSAGNGDVFVSKLESNGDFVWAKRMGGTGEDGGEGITIDSSGNVYTTGIFQGNADFDPGADTFNLASAGGYDIFISKLENEVTPLPQQLIVTKTADTNDGVCNTDCSLREAIAVASTGNTITFDPSLSGGTIYLASSLLIDKSLTIDGSSLASHIKISGDTNNDGTGDVSVLQVSEPPLVELNGVDIVNGKASGTSGGGGIANYGTLTIKNSTVSGNSYSGGIGGGGIYNKGELTIIDSIVSGNSAKDGGDGGGIFNEQGHTLTITGSTFSDNNAALFGDGFQGTGGGISNIGTLFVDESTFLDNDGYGGGGAIFNGINGVSTIKNSSFTNNTVFGYGLGGAIHNYEGNMVIENCIFTDNSQIGIGHYGGAVYNEDQMSITDSTFTGNSSSNKGGGIANLGVLTVTNSTLTNNSADFGLGGGIANYGNLTITSSNISENSAITGGGGVLNDNDGIVNVVNSTISNNSSAGSGGGILNLSPTGTVNISNSTLLGNSASTEGGGVVNFGTLNYANTIIANSTSGVDCYNDEQYGVINTNIHNLVENNATSLNRCGTPSLTSDPKLGPLADNGGATYTMALLPNSPAIDTGDNDTCEGTDQRGIARPQGMHCDIGAFEYVDTSPPSALSIARLDTDPTSASNVDFIITFSKSVTNVDMTGPTFDDFILTTSAGISNASITAVSGAGAAYTVTVNTGSGNGTIRLDVLDNAGITDLIGNLLANLPFTDGAVYTIIKTSAFSSAALNDGWTLESSEYSSRANARNSSETLLVGDNVKNRQYRSLLYFDTASLPNNAVISSVTVKIKQEGITGTNPFTTHGALLADMANGFFGKSPLENTDFQAKGAPRPVGSFTPVSGEAGWYELVLNPANFKYVNLAGVTQFRLRFSKDDNNNKVADFISFYSGDDATNPPQLIVEYYVP